MKPKKIPFSPVLAHQAQDILDNIPFLLMEELDNSNLEDDNEDS